MRKLVIVVLLPLYILGIYSCDINNSDNIEYPIIEPNDYRFTEAFPNKKSELVTLKSGIKIEKKEESHVWQGDIVLSASQLKALDEYGTIFTENMPTAFQLWDTTIPFSINPQIPDEVKENILAVIKNWEELTNLKFSNISKQLNQSEYGLDYIEFVVGNGNWSSIGKIGGKQLISIDTSNITLFTSFAYSLNHTIGHTLGMLNIENRNDRDNYITIHSENIKSDKLHCFNKMEPHEFVVGEFDFKSIMLLPSYNNWAAYPNNESVTMSSKSYLESKINTWGGNTSLSIGDIEWLNTFYKE